MPVRGDPCRGNNNGQPVPGRLDHGDSGHRRQTKAIAGLPRAPGRRGVPAVVVPRQCSGFDNVVATWTDRLARWGYVAVALDSLTSRGQKTGCRGGANEQAHDAYRALGFLASQPFVKADRISLLGMSLDAGATLAAFERCGMEKLFARKFRAAVAFSSPPRRAPAVVSWGIGCNTMRPRPMTRPTAFAASSSAR
jgi:dienelactone hydrolase